MNEVLVDGAARLLQAGVRPFTDVASNGGSRIFFVYLLAALGLAAWVFLRERRAHAQDPTANGLAVFLAFLAPRSIWTHTSARTDVVLMVLASVLLLTVATLVVPDAKALVAWTVAVVGQASQLDRSVDAFWLAVALTLLLFVVDDFAKFFIHYLMHRVPALWEIHKVHHSAEVLTPFTAFRFHPLELVLTAVWVISFVAIANGAFIAAVGGRVETLTLFGANIGLVFFNLLGGTLRHSHVWLSFGPRWERHFISPAQHQIHHSSLPCHADRNMGYHLAIWDRLAGTLYVPEGRERFPFGIGRQTPQYRGVAECLVRPLARAPLTAWHGAKGLLAARRARDVSA